MRRDADDPRDSALVASRPWRATPRCAFQRFEFVVPRDVPERRVRRRPKEILRSPATPLRNGTPRVLSGRERLENDRPRERLRREINRRRAQGARGASEVALQNAERARHERIARPASQKRNCLEDKKNRQRHGPDARRRGREGPCRSRDPASQASGRPEGCDPDEGIDAQPVGRSARVPEDSREQARAGEETQQLVPRAPVPGFAVRQPGAHESGDAQESVEGGAVRESVTRVGVAGPEKKARVLDAVVEEAQRRSAGPVASGNRHVFRRGEKRNVVRAAAETLGVLEEGGGEWKEGEKRGSRRRQGELRARRPTKTSDRA